jgi:type II secretory pathway component PulK
MDGAQTMFRGMEKLIALTVVIVIVVFLATYALSAWSEHR